jgi:hypothetical protein
MQKRCRVILKWLRKQVGRVQTGLMWLGWNRDLWYDLVNTIINLLALLKVGLTTLDIYSPHHCINGVIFTTILVLENKDCLSKLQQVTTTASTMHHSIYGDNQNNRKRHNIHSLR